MGGVEIPNAKRIEFSLRYVYGIGHTTAKAILADTVFTLTSNLAAVATPAWCKHADWSQVMHQATQLDSKRVQEADHMLLACPDSPYVLKKAGAQR